MSKSIQKTRDQSSDEDIETLSKDVIELLQKQAKKKKRHDQSSEDFDDTERKRDRKRKEKD